MDNLNDRIRVFNDTGSTFYLNVPNSSKQYKIGPAIKNVPGSALVPTLEIEEILNSDGGRELLTKRLRFETPETSDKLGIDSNERMIPNATIINQLKGTNYKLFDEWLEKNSDPSVLERLPKLIADNKITDINILKRVETATGIQLLGRVDELDVTNTEE